MPSPHHMPSPHQIKGSVPIPDPTSLTTLQLIRELSLLREIIEKRIEGSDKVVSKLIADVERMPLQIDLRVSHLRSLHEEKFSSISTQFAERDTRTEQTSRDSKVAVDAALQAAKEAVGEQNRSSALAIAKSEASTMKQIDQLVVLIQTNTGASDGKINDLKERVTTIQSHTKGAGDSIGWIIGVGGFVVALASILFAVLKK